jgi:hypothetical protein
MSSSVTRRPRVVDEPLLRLDQHLAQGKHANQERHKADAAGQLDRSEGKPLVSGHWVEADAGKENAERGRDQALGQARCAQRRDHGHGKGEQQRKLGRPKLERDGGERLGHENEHHGRQ